MRTGANGSQSPGRNGFPNRLMCLAGAAFVLVCMAYSNPAQAVEDGTVFIECPPDAQVECGGDTSPEATGEAIATDNGGLVTIIYDDSFSPGCGQTGTIIRTWTATDENGESTSCNQIIEVVDTTPPEIFCPPDTQVECDEPTDPGTTGIATATDDCGGVATVDYYDDETPGDCPNNYTIRRTWVVRDYCDNESQCEQVIEVVDTIPPVFLDCPTDVTAECDALILQPEVDAVDNCDPSPVVTHSQTVTPGDCPQEYSITETWTATDACGNTATCSRTITMVDTTPPVLLGCPTDVTIQCNQLILQPEVNAYDNCDPGPVVTHSRTLTPGGCPQEYTITETWTATDACGNSSTCGRTITVVDVTPPEITCPPDMTVQCLDGVPPPDVSAVVAFDNCSAVTVTHVGDTAKGACPVEIARTYQAVDACGNISTCIQTIIVTDTTPPVFNEAPPADQTVECDNVPDPPILTASDNCDPDVTVVVTETRADGDCSNNYTLVRTWTATDDCGNTTGHNQLITVQDTTPPTLLYCPPDATYECDAVPDDLGSPVFSDNCDDSLIILPFSRVIIGECRQEFTILRRWTALDNCRNGSICDQIITVIDTTPPDVVWPEDLILVCDECDTDPSNTGEPDAYDNCGLITTTYTDEVKGDCPKRIERTWTVSDGCNTVSDVQVIQCLPKFKVTLTDGNLCTFDMDPATECKDFRLLFTQDPKNWPSYKLTAANPGQAFINAHFVGRPGEEVLFVFTLPYPYVTRGKSPIRAYDWVDMIPINNGSTHDYCLIPGNEINANGLDPITLDDYGTLDHDVIITQTLTLKVPDTGVLFVNVHIEYGLKGVGGILNNSYDDAVDAIDEDLILIPNNWEYPFSSTVVDYDIESDEAYLCNINVFKKLPGVGGLAGRPTTTFDGEEDFKPVEGCTVELKDPEGNVVATGVSDEDGWYMCAYKHTGKPTTFTVTLTPPGGGAPQTQSVQLKANHYGEVNFSLP